MDYNKVFVGSSELNSGRKKKKDILLNILGCENHTSEENTVLFFCVCARIHIENKF